MKDKIAIICVHGTWARRADWSSPTSVFRQAITRELSEEFDVRIEEFLWSGRNSQKARLIAAAKLGERISSISDGFDQERIFIIGHSHGGNVALYAMNANGAAGIQGVVSMSTPFLNVTARTRHDGDKKKWALTHDRLIGVGGTIFVALALGLVGAFWFPKNEADHPGLITYTASALMGIVLIGLVAFVNRSETVAQRAIDGFGYPELTNDQLFVCGTAWDEAAVSLLIFDMLATLPNVLKQPKLVGALSAIFALVFIATMWEMYVWQSGVFHSGFFDAANACVALALALFVALGAPAAIVIMSSLGLTLFKGYLMGYGYGMSFYLHADVRASRTPAGHKRWYAYVIGDGKGLTHSKIYQDSSVARDIGVWINQRCRTPVADRPCLGRQS